MRNDDDENTAQSQRGNSLEPRVTALEVGLDRLTSDVKDLATVVRLQGQTVEQEIQKLVVAVTQASGPKKTDWGTIIAGVGLILAIASAAFWPLNQQVQDTKQALTLIQASVIEHQRMDNHPVGAAILQRLEEQLKIHTDINKREMEERIAQGLRDHAAVENSLQKEITALSEKNQLYMDKLYQRVVALEEGEKKQGEMDRQELLQWRQKAMGLTSPNASVPLVPREMPDSK